MPDVVELRYGHTPHVELVVLGFLLSLAHGRGIEGVAILVEWRTVVCALVEWVHVARIVEMYLPVIFVHPVEVAFNAVRPRAQLAIETERMSHSKIGIGAEQAGRHHQETASGSDLRAGKGIFMSLWFYQVGIALHLEAYHCSQ